MPDISTPNLDYGNMVQAWDINDALMGGTLYMRQLGEAYLPRWPKEDKEDYKKRLDVATLLPAYEETINQNVGRVLLSLSSLVRMYRMRCANMQRCGSGRYSP
jgi:hypothetical protein